MNLGVRLVLLSGTILLAMGCREPRPRPPVAAAAPEVAVEGRLQIVDGMWMCCLQVENHGTADMWVADSFFARVEYEGPDGVAAYGTFRLMKPDPNYVRLAPVVKVSKGYLSHQFVPVDLPLHSSAGDPGARHVKVRLDVTILEGQGSRIMERTLTQEIELQSGHD